MDGLQVEGIHKTYGTATVVDNVSFQAPQGKILGVLGPNGAGKTTIIRMVMGITAPDGGQVLFTDRGVRTSGIPLETIGYLPEERGLYKEAKVMTVLLFLAGLKNVPKAEAKKRALNWLRKFDLEDYADKKIETLSKGMAQKVQFTAAVLHEPRFIVLDEPFTGLDPVSQDQFKKEVRALADAGATVLLSSHQMNMVEEVCDDIFLIHRGREVVKGDLQSIRERYGNFKVNLLSSTAPTAILATGLVENYEQFNEGRYNFTLKEGVRPTDFLQQLPATLEIREMSISRPSLHDIFVKIAQGGAEVA